MNKSANKIALDTEEKRYIDYENDLEEDESKMEEVARSKIHKFKIK